MILGRNVKQDTTTLPFLLLELFPFVFLEIDFVSALYLKYPLEYFDGPW